MLDQGIKNAPYGRIFLREVIALFKKLGFGTMRLPLLNADDTKSIDIEQFKKMADMFIERGFCYFDTAYPYHGECSENALKKAVIERYPREKLIIADKMPILRVQATADYQKYFDEQIKRCGTDYFDFYLLHNMGRDRYIKTQRYGGFEFISALKKKGDVRKIGFSFHDDADTLDRILSEHPEVDFVQLQINYLDWDGAVAQSGRCYNVAKKHNKEVLVMEPVKGGTLANLPDKAMQLFNGFYGENAPTPASLAVRYAASLENVKIVLSGMSNIAQLENNTSYMQDFKPLTDGERELVKNITSVLKSTIKVQCTGCRYCLEECPKNINIPDYFGLLNLHAVTGKKTNMYYERFSMNYAKASECLKCGRCENICPQHIDIRKYLEEFAALYEENA
ncbi:MAG: aldo/keto reductase [Firmicutes bacterium]|nr:aldo/keto reductase [Bacillota bacterium]